MNEERRFTAERRTSESLILFGTIGVLLVLGAHSGCFILRLVNPATGYGAKYLHIWPADVEATENQRWSGPVAWSASVDQREVGVPSIGILPLSAHIEASAIRATFKNWARPLCCRMGVLRQPGLATVCRACDHWRPRLGVVGPPPITLSILDTLNPLHENLG